MQKSGASLATASSAPRRGVSGPFLNEEFSRLIEKIISQIEVFRTLDGPKILLSITRSRSQGKVGVWAYVTPLRYRGGAPHRRGRRRGIPGIYRYRAERIEREAPEALYLMTFLVPRFFQLSFQERLETIIHELYHIHPEFRGDLRRFPAPHVHHGPTPKAFRQAVREMTEDLLRRCPEFHHEVLLCGEENLFSGFVLKHYPIPRHVFIPLAVMERNSEAKVLNRPKHPRLLERLLKYLCASMLFGTTSLAQVGIDSDFLMEDSEAAFPQTSAAEAREEKTARAMPAEEERVDFGGQGTAGRLPYRGGLLPQRFLVEVQGLEEPTLRPAPGEVSPELFPVEAGEVFFWANEDRTREWAFIQTRRKSGWIRKRYLKVVKALPVPGEIEAMQALNGDSGEGATFSGTLIDGETAFDPNRPFVRRDGSLDSIDSGHLDGLKEGHDIVTTLEPGQFYAEPNPLAERYGLIEAGDQVTFLKRDSSDKWAKIRLELTGEEGWYPAAWLRVNRLGAFREPSRMGRLNLEVDLGYGSQGYNMGGTVLLSWDSRWTRGGSSRFELGAFASYWAGESMAVDTSSFQVSYMQLGFVPRYVAFNGVGNLAGALEAGILMRLPQGSIDGLDPDVVETNNLDLLLRPGLAMVFGARAYYVLSSSLQAHLGFRGSLTASANAYYFLSGIAFKFL